MEKGDNNIKTRKIFKKTAKRVLYLHNFNKDRRLLTHHKEVCKLKFKLILILIKLSEIHGEERVVVLNNFKKYRI